MAPKTHEHIVADQPRAPSLPGKIVVVVGAGIGSGLETLKHFARTNPERIVVVASDVHYWTTSEKELFESPNILAKLSSKESCTPEIMKRRSNGYQEADAKQKTELAFTTVDSEGSRQLMFSAVGGTNGEDKLRGACISLSKVVEECDFVISEDVQDKVWYLKNWIHGVPLRSKGKSNK
ncbi:hypothetical protein EV421DRAFT_2019226 [Armillaria borealis]|uniref:Uncharacterized protein n=1 Tax=Armillaria borealis TaxID=47425 RepID=A0AA39MQF8_9AGAR|nr:hypothetical protein EV421DRAFT_2019226 [Armillaria borealis]